MAQKKHTGWERKKARMTEARIRRSAEARAKKQEAK